jgi:single-strand DNA-binding protein
MKGDLLKMTNHITILGRLTKDPDVKYVASGKAVATFTMAVDRPFTGQDGKREADFIPVVIWGKTAEMVGNSCAKGHRLLVEGRLQIRNFDAKDGTKHWVTEVIANSVEFIERKEQAKKMTDMGQSVPYDSEEVFF